MFFEIVLGVSCFWVFFIIRTEWTFKTQISINRKMDVILAHERENLDTSKDINREDFEAMLYCLLPFDPMFKRFWIWDIEKFVVNQRGYEMLNKMYTEITA